MKSQRQLASHVSLYCTQRPDGRYQAQIFSHGILLAEAEAPDGQQAIERVVDVVRMRQYPEIDNEYR